MKEEIKAYVKKWMDSHEPDTFIKNQYGNVVYSAGPTSLDLTTFFEMLLEDFIDDSSTDNTARTAEQFLTDFYRD